MPFSPFPAYTSKVNEPGWLAGMHAQHLCAYFIFTSCWSLSGSSSTKERPGRVIATPGRGLFKLPGCRRRRLEKWREREEEMEEISGDLCLVLLPRVIRKHCVFSSFLEQAGIGEKPLKGLPRTTGRLFMHARRRRGGETDGHVLYYLIERQNLLIVIVWSREIAILPASLPLKAGKGGKGRRDKDCVAATGWSIPPRSLLS